MIWISKVWDVLPSPTVTVAGTIANPLLLVSAIDVPAGAAVPSVRVPVSTVPPDAELADNDRLWRTGSPTASVAVWLVPPYVAVIVVDDTDDTSAVAIGNVWVVEPTGTVTVAGTVAAEMSLLVSITEAPSDGAAPLKVMVPVTIIPGAAALADSDKALMLPEVVGAVGDEDEHATVAEIATKATSVRPRFGRC